MTDQRPNLGQQLEAVNWALLHMREAGRRAKLRAAEVEELIRRLEAAGDTLRTLEFGRAVLR